MASKKYTKEDGNFVLIPRHRARYRTPSVSSIVCEKLGLEFGKYYADEAEAQRDADKINEYNREQGKNITYIVKDISPKKPDPRRNTTCQICGRAILANTGLIAHHGYQRPGDGWQTASCEGANALPYEKDRTVLGEHIEGLKKAIEIKERFLTSLRTENPSITFTGYRRNWDKGGRNEYFSETFTVDMPKYAEKKEAKIHKVVQEIRMYQSFLNDQQKRYDAWKAPVEA